MIFLQVMVTVSDITANNVTLRKVNSPGCGIRESHHSLSHSHHSFDELEPLPLSPPAVNAMNEPIAANPAHMEMLGKYSNKMPIRSVRSFNSENSLVEALKYRFHLNYKQIFCNIVKLRAPVF